MQPTRTAAWALALGLALTPAILAGPPDAAAEVPSIEAGLVSAAGPIMEECSRRGYRNIGVLKFAVSKDGKNFPDQVGTLNLYLAQRLEPALFLRNKFEEKIGIAENASAVAAKIDGADHLKPEGRTKLFTGQYPLLWGTKVVSADAFVTGIATVGPDLETVTVQIYLIDRDLYRAFGKPFAVKCRANLLVEMGENYAATDPAAFRKIDAVAARLKDADPAVARKAVEDARRKIDAGALGRAADPNRPNSLADPKAPVKLSVRYDGVEQKFEFKDNRAFVAEPSESVKAVELVLTRLWETEPLKAVIKVNGVNTLYKQTAPDHHCLGWLLDPADAPGLTVDGYQATADDKEKFRILSRAESKVNERRYGADVGTISLSVFREARPMPPADESDRARQLEIVSKGKAPPENRKEENYNAALDNFMKGAHRGLIGEGERLPGRAVRVSKAWEPTPVMTATVVYYKP